MVIPPACFGTYRRQLLISSIWPLIAMLAVVAYYYVCWELAPAMAERAWQPPTEEDRAELRRHSGTDGVRTRLYTPGEGTATAPAGV
eukprot:4345214-Prymnesium_polylepis.1